MSAASQTNPMRRETHTADDFYVLDSYFSDTEELPRPIRAFIVGTAGDVVLVNKRGEAQAAWPVYAGQRVEISPLRINATNTTASNLMGLC